MGITRLHARNGERVSVTLCDSECNFVQRRLHVTGLAQFIPITRFCAKEHRAREDGRATARHLHGKIERAARCLTVKVSAESAGAVASNVVFFESLATRQSGRLAQPDGVVLAHLQGVAATFRVGRHHHRGPLHEGRGLTHALTHIAPTDLAPSGGARACGRNR